MFVWNFVYEVFTHTFKLTRASIFIPTLQMRKLLNVKQLISNRTGTQTCLSCYSLLPFQCGQWKGDIN